MLSIIESERNNVLAENIIKGFNESLLVKLVKFTLFVMLIIESVD